MARTAQEDMDLINVNDSDDQRYIDVEDFDGLDEEILNGISVAPEHFDYEAYRRQNIEKNNQIMESLGIKTAAAALQKNVNKSPRPRPAQRTPRTQPDIPTRDRLDREAKRNLSDGVYGEPMFRMAPPNAPYTTSPSAMLFGVDISDPAFKENEANATNGCSSGCPDGEASSSLALPPPDEDPDKVLREGLGSRFVTPQPSGLCSWMVSPFGSVFNSPEKPKNTIRAIRTMNSKSPEKMDHERLAFAASVPETASVSESVTESNKRKVMELEFDSQRQIWWTAKESARRLKRKHSAGSVNKIDGRKVPMQMKSTFLPDRCMGYCNCPRTGCTNNNCECMKQGRPCNELCKCSGDNWCCDMFGNKRQCKNAHGVSFSKEAQDKVSMLQDKYFQMHVGSSSITSKRTLEMSNSDDGHSSTIALLANFARRASMPPAIVSGTKNVSEKEEASSSKEPAMCFTMPPRTHHDVCKSCLEKVDVFVDLSKECMNVEQRDAKCEAFVTTIKDMAVSMDQIWSALPEIQANDMNELDHRVQEWYCKVAQILARTSALDDAMLMVDRSLAMAKSQFRTYEKSVCYKLKGVICTRQEKYQQAVCFFQACLKHKKRMNKKKTTDYKKIKKEIKAIRSAFLS